MAFVLSIPLRKTPPSRNGKKDQGKEDKTKAPIKGLLN
jgi:hypothetical protein